MSNAAGPGPKRIIVLGATSAIAEATARIWAAQGGRFALCGRNAARLEDIAADLKCRGAGGVETVCLDLAAADVPGEFDRMVKHLGAVDVILLAYGVLGDQRKAEDDVAEARAVIETNFTSAAAWCLAAADRLERQNAGALIVIGSVAGDRGRKSNYVYGAAKAALAILVTGIAHRLSATAARAVLVKPGWVDTPMTAHIPGKGLLWAGPDAIAKVIVKSVERGGAVVYAPWWWRMIMLVIRLLPERLFHKTNF